jgi:hypothetical protein
MEAGQYPDDTALRYNMRGVLDVWSLAAIAAISAAESVTGLTAFNRSR